MHPDQWPDGSNENNLSRRSADHVPDQWPDGSFKRLPDGTRQAAPRAQYKEEAEAAPEGHAGRAGEDEGTDGESPRRESQGMRSLLILITVIAWIAAALLLRENDRLRAENELIRYERDEATSAARQLWETINRAAAQ